MDFTKINKTIFSKKVKDYTFVILFLLIFSIFIFFAIRPSLTTAFSLKKEEFDLEKVDSLYEKKITNISLIQSQIEENRDDLFLLDEAMSHYPKVNKIVEDVKMAADKNNLFIKNAKIADVNLFKKQDNLDKVQLMIEGRASFDDMMNFISDIFNQRRIKTVDRLTIRRDKEATGDANLKVVLTIEGYYL